MDIAPSANLLRSLRGERIDYGLLIGEGTDNAFDAGATMLEITLAPDALTFQDNGVGITRDRIGSLFRLGDHGAMPTSALGRFGIGIKSQAVNAGDRFEVTSVSREGRVQAEVDWRSVLRGGHWTMPDPRWLPLLIGTPTGTTITIAALRKPPALSLDRIRDELALRFYPALVGDARIVLNGQPIEALREPAMTDIIDRQIALSDGRSAHLRAGILAAPGKLNQVHVAYKHRVIMPASTLGCGSYGGLTKMFARLQLDGPWHLAKFKNDLPDETEREELDEAIEEALTPILEKCATASISARVDAMLDMVNAMLPPELIPARPRHTGKTKQATVKERKKRSGNVTEPEGKDGPATTRKPPHDRIIITFEGIAAESGIGYFQPGRPHRVNLSRDDPFIASLLSLRDQAVAARSIYAVAIVLFEQGRNDLDPELSFEPFGKRIAKLLTLQEHESAAASG